PPTPAPLPYTTLFRSETIQVEQGYASPTSALEAARMILRLLEEEAYGTYHATCQGVCSRYEFARKIAQLSGKEAKIEEMAVRRKDRKSTRLNSSHVSI